MDIYGFWENINAVERIAAEKSEMKFVGEILNREIEDVIYRFEDFLKIVKGDFICEVTGKRIDKSNMDTETYRNYGVVSIGVEDDALLVKLKPFESVTPECSLNADWVKVHKAQLGAEPSFF